MHKKTRFLPLKLDIKNTQHKSVERNQFSSCISGRSTLKKNSLKFYIFIASVVAAALTAAQKQY